MTSFFIENPSFFSAGVFDEKAGGLDKKTRVFDEKGVELLMKNARVFDKKKREVSMKTAVVVDEKCESFR